MFLRWAEAHRSARVIPGLVNDVYYFSVMPNNSKVRLQSVKLALDLDENRAGRKVIQRGEPRLCSCFGASVQTRAQLQQSFLPAQRGSRRPGTAWPRCSGSWDCAGQPLALTCSCPAQLLEPSVRGGAWVGLTLFPPTSLALALVPFPLLTAWNQAPFALESWRWCFGCI